jgi:hypothetical protein
MFGFYNRDIVFTARYGLDLYIERRLTGIYIDVPWPLFYSISLIILNLIFSSSSYVFIFILLSPEGRTGEACQLSKK